jgi:hypothetical protein
MLWKGTMVPLPSSGRSFRNLQLNAFPYKMNKAEMKWMVRELCTAQLDELVIQDLGLDTSEQRNSTMNSLLKQ